MEVNGCRQRRGLDVKFASKLDFSAEALVAHTGLRLITVSSKWVDRRSSCLIMKSQSFYLSSYFVSVGKVIFPSGRRKFPWVKFKNALGNECEKYSLGRPNFCVGEGFVGSVYTWGCF